MKTNALSIANYFIDLAKKDEREIKPLKLMKLVYITYGYALASLDKSIINPRFDKVEAWRLGPVIPSVYHSFKMYGNNPITQKTTVIIEDSDPVKVEEPKLEDKDVMKVCLFVWNNYAKCEDSQLVTLLHKSGTPWSVVYKKDMNNSIPESLTKLYYHKLLCNLRAKGLPYE